MALWKFYSWNVNGYRAIWKKGFAGWLAGSDADAVFLQETKALPEQLEDEARHPAGYTGVWNPARVRKGYSGVAALYRKEPLSISTGLPDERFRGEGRLVLLEYPAFYVAGVYFPNGQKGEERLRFKLDYYDAFLEYAETLRRNKPIILCGDVNTAHKDIDLAHPDRNAKTSGFLPIERQWLDTFMARGWVDCFRRFNQDPGHYTWWAPWRNARERNIGWRIDYFFVTTELADRVQDCWHATEVMDSDHCPVGLSIKTDD
ncbi:MAG: exodeoxyribonuclease III [Oceanidesulfovibrio sp.]